MIKMVYGTGVKAHAFNLSTWERVAGRSLVVWGEPGLHSEFWANENLSQKQQQMRGYRIKKSSQKMTQKCWEMVKQVLDIFIHKENTNLNYCDFFLTIQNDQHQWS